MDGVERGGDSHAFPGFIVFHNLDFASILPFSWRSTGVVSCTICRKKPRISLFDIFDVSKSSHVRLDIIAEMVYIPSNFKTLHLLLDRERRIAR